MPFLFVRTNFFCQKLVSPEFRNQHNAQRVQHKPDDGHGGGRMERNHVERNEIGYIGMKLYAKLCSNLISFLPRARTHTVRATGLTQTQPHAHTNTKGTDWRSFIGQISFSQTHNTMSIPYAPLLVSFLLLIRRWIVWNLFFGSFFGTIMAFKWLN